MNELQVKSLKLFVESKQKQLNLNQNRNQIKTKLYKQKQNCSKLTNLCFYLLSLTFFIIESNITQSNQFAASSSTDKRQARSLSLFGGSSSSLSVSQIDLSQPPEFLEPIGNHTVPVGRDAHLSCKLSHLGNFIVS